MPGRSGLKMRRYSAPVSTFPQRSVRKNGVATTPAPVKEPLSAACVVGDFVFLLAKDGTIQNATPYLIKRIERGADGVDYALFLDSDTGWPLNQCERADPPLSNGTHAPDAGLPLTAMVSVDACPQCGCTELMNCVTYKKCPLCPWKDGPTPQEILDPREARP
jgi:hypothetical protein